MWDDFLDLVRAQWHFFTHWWWAELLFIAVVAFFALMVWAATDGY